jgi:hypothetical protein
VRGDEPCPHRPIANPQVFGDLFQALAFCIHSQNQVAVYGSHWGTALLALRSRIPNPGSYPLTNQITLQLSDGRNDGEERLTQRTARIYVFLITDEMNAERPKFFLR